MHNRLACLCLLLAYGCTTALVFGQGPAIRIATISPVEKNLQRLVEQPALIEAYAVAPLHAKVAGYVQSVPVEIGQTVKAGDQLLMIAVPELMAAQKQKTALIAQAKAVVEQAKAAIEVASAAEVSATAQTEELTALIEKAKAEVNRYQSELDRVTQLVATNAVPTKVRDEVLSQSQAAAANLSAATAKQKTGTALIAEAKAKSQAAQADLRAAQAKVAVAEADLEQIQVQIQDAVLQAPFDGQIAKRTVDQGHLVTGNSTGHAPLLTIVQTDKLRVLVEVPEIEAGYLAAGNPIAIRIPALSNQVIQSTVTRVAGAIDTSTRTLRAEIELPNADQKLKPGLFAHAVITVAERKQVLTIPNSAILTETGKTFCLAVEKGLIVKLPVTLGLRAGAEVEVLDGLSKTIAIVPKNPANYTAGQAAEIIPTPPK